MTPPTHIFGAGFLGVSFATTSECEALLDFLKGQGIRRIDTARRYPSLQPGRSEQLLGEAKAAGQGFTIDTKIKISPEEGVAGSLTATKIRASIAESFDALGVKQVNVLHCHTPDPETPIEETAAALDEAFKEGYFKKLGVANYSVRQIEEWMQISEDKGYVKPTVYQGQYNLLCRRPEQDLMPTLRKYGMVYNAYSPLAGGFLTGKTTAGQVAGTRFEPGNKMGAAHTNWYDKPVMHDAVRNLQKVVEPRGLTLTEVSMRWLVHHSALGEGDGVIVGGRRFEQIGGNVKDVKKGLLPKELVEEIDEMWGLMKDEAP